MADFTYNSVDYSLSTPPEYPIEVSMDDAGVIRNKFEGGYTFTRSRFTRVNYEYALHYKYLINSDVTTLNSLFTATKFSAVFTWFNPKGDANSTTSLTIGTGSKSLTVQTGLSLATGNEVDIRYTENGAKSMHGMITSYNSSTGALVVNVTSISGSGTYASWLVVQGITVRFKTTPKLSYVLYGRWDCEMALETV